MVTTTASHLTQAEQTDNYFSVIKSDKKAKMNYELANAHIKGWHPFSLCTSTEWDPFWKRHSVVLGCHLTATLYHPAFWWSPVTPTRLVYKPRCELRLLCASL
jgi:hypothetical protein